MSLSVRAEIFESFNQFGSSTNFFARSTISSLMSASDDATLADKSSVATKLTLFSVDVASVEF